jgi:hypothetical protein
LLLQLPLALLRLPLRLRLPLPLQWQSQRPLQWQLLLLLQWPLSLPLRLWLPCRCGSPVTGYWLLVAVAFAEVLVLFVAIPEGICCCLCF